MSVASALRRLRGIRGRWPASGSPGARYDVLSDRYVCPSGRHEAEDTSGLTCACGRTLSQAVPPGRPLVPAPRLELVA